MMLLNDLPSSLLTVVYDFLTPYDLIKLLLLVSKYPLPFLNGPETRRKLVEHLIHKWGLSTTNEKSKVEEELLIMEGVQDLARLLVMAQPLPQGLFTNEAELDLIVDHDTAWYRGTIGLGNRSVQSFVPFPPIHPKMAVTLLSAVKELSAWSMLMIDRFVNTVRASVPRTVTSVVPINVNMYTRLSSSQLPNALINFAMMKQNSIEGFSLPTSLTSSPLIRRKRSVSLPTVGSSSGSHRRTNNNQVGGLGSFFDFDFITFAGTSTTDHPHQQQPRRHVDVPNSFSTPLFLECSANDGPSSCRWTGRSGLYGGLIGRSVEVYVRPRFIAYYEVRLSPLATRQRVDNAIITTTINTTAAVATTMTTIATTPTATMTPFNTTTTTATTTTTTTTNFIAPPAAVTINPFQIHPVFDDTLMAMVVDDDDQDHHVAGTGLGIVDMDLEEGLENIAANNNNNNTTTATNTINTPPILPIINNNDDDENSACVAVGLATKAFMKHKRLPGWDCDSYGYHSDDGAIFHGQGRQLSKFGPSFGVGDVVGCGVDYSNGSIFFTLNGVFLGTAFHLTHSINKDGDMSSMSSMELFPTVGIDAPVQVAFNHGREPFVFDFVGFVAKREEEVRRG